MLVQRIGDHSLLVTFEHVEDAAFRNTLVVDERHGIARRRIAYRERGLPLALRLCTSALPAPGDALKAAMRRVPDAAKI